MIQVRSARSSIFLNSTFAPPIFDWQGVPARFFEMVHTALSPGIVISPQDFSVRQGNSLDEVGAKYSLFGGPASINLSSEVLSIEFPNVSDTEYEMALRIINSIDKHFCIDFPNRKYTTVQMATFEHAEFVSEEEVIAYLGRYRVSSIDKACATFGAVYAPSGRFFLSGKTWSALCSVERSEHSSNAVFLHFDLTLYAIQENETFYDKMSQFKRVSNVCMNALDLEWVDVG